MQEQLDWQSDGLELPFSGCCRCHSNQPGRKLTTRISVHDYLQLERGMFSQEVGPVTLQPALKEMLVKKVCEISLIASTADKIFTKCAKADVEKLRMMTFCTTFLIPLVWGSRVY